MDDPPFPPPRRTLARAGASPTGPFSVTAWAADLTAGPPPVSPPPRVSPSPRGSSGAFLSADERHEGSTPIARSGADVRAEHDPPPDPVPDPAGRTVRDAAFDVLRRRGLDRIFANPGSTEISLLTDLPDDLEFVLALHEGSVVGLATGYATATDRPALVVLHTTAGLGNAVGALATARVNRTPLVVVVGQQDRRHLASQPFLAGDLDGLGGSYPVWTTTPVRPQDVPGALDRAFHEAQTSRGPAVVVVPSDDWAEPADHRTLPSPVAVRRGYAPDPEAVAELAAVVGNARCPAIVVGADADTPRAWDALVGLAEHLLAPVWQEAFAARAGFPQDHPLFAGHLPPERATLRAALGAYDLLLVVGAPVFRQYQYSPGELVEPGTTIVLVGDDPEDVHHSRADLALLADPALTVTALTAALPAASHPCCAPPAPHEGNPRPDRTTESSPRGPDAPLDPPVVFTELAARLPADAVVVEETPSSRPDLHRLVPARAPLGFLSAAQGGLGFGVPAAIGVRMGAPTRPVVAVVGDGSTLYGVQALWSAAHYGVGVLVLVMDNGRYAIMDRLASEAGGKAPWPGFAEVDVAGLATSLGCPSRRVGTHGELTEVLDDVVPGLADRETPLVVVCSLDLTAV
ncbi:thiamine pyrophosphate-dependent enzyme [Actinomycetospora endophytica]|uniref:Thiamine pyrophosphate-dependent enzyme n=1 Tax=Actinomycetospora endophytica TaxID=2291215 RepID=A0ABS8PA14_9PSEU|nr:thiamine pyrophosphate-dependent enzyme [Actinomycetospora endophytica]MCD2194767.1 thiamine pyrophosphate-dependent enzyme [Actinomycetospora endophytica]